MVSLDWDTTTAGDATLVTLVLSSADPTHVRVENCLDGPVWPPRRQGVPAAGWDDEGFAGVVDGQLALGYASPATPADPPARITETRPPTDDEDLTAEKLVRQLGDASPPSDVLAPAVDDRVVAPTDGDDAEPTPPAAVVTWLDDVDARLTDADRLADATSVSEASEAVVAVGGAGAVQTLRDQVVADRRTLRTVADRCEALADRAETVEIPVETLARLA